MTPVPSAPSVLADNNGVVPVIPVMTKPTDENILGVGRGRAPGGVCPYPDDRYLRARLLAASRSNSGALLQLAGRPAEAMEEYHAAIGVRMEALRAEDGSSSFPSNSRPNPTLVVNNETSPTSPKRAKKRASVEDYEAQTEAYQEALDREGALLTDCFGPSESNSAAAAQARNASLSFGQGVDLFRRVTSETAMDEPPCLLVGDDEAEAQQQHRHRMNKPFADLAISSPILVDRSSMFGSGGAGAGSSGGGNDCVESAATLLNMALWHADRAGDASTVEIHRSESARAMQLLHMALSILPDHEGTAASSGCSRLCQETTRAAERCVSAGNYDAYVAGRQYQDLAQGIYPQDRFLQCSSTARVHEGAPRVYPVQDEGALADNDSPPLPTVYWTLASTVHSALGKLHLSADPYSPEALSHLARAWIFACLSVLHLPDDASHPLVLSTLSNLGHAHYRRSEMSHAVSACRASLHLLRPLEGDATAVVARKKLDASRTLHNIATVHYACGQQGLALGQYAAFLGLYRAEDDLRARTLHRMGRIYLSVRDPRGAVGPLSDAAELTSRLLRSSSSGVGSDAGASTLSTMATTSEGSGEEGEAGGSIHPGLIPVLDDLGTAYLESNMPHDALRAYRRALAIVGLTSGQRSADAAAQLCNVGHVYFLSGYFEEAVKCFREALDIIEDLAPEEEMDDDDDNDGQIHQRQDDSPPQEEGDLRPEEALTFQIQLLNHLGTAQLESGDPEAALATFEEASEQERRAMNMTPVPPLAPPSTFAAAGPYSQWHWQHQQHPVVTPAAIAQTQRGAAMARARLPVATSVNILALMGLTSTGTASGGGVEDFFQTAPAA